MLDPGRYFAEAIYFLQYTCAQLLWAIARATLSIAVIAESINRWLTDNVGYFVQLLVNALSAPLGGLFILALTALGFWYALNNILPTPRWVDPSRLFSYGLIAFFFFSSPIVVVEMMEELRQSLNAGIDAALIDGATGDIFASDMDGTDSGLPGAIPDVNSDGVIGSFDLVTAFLAVANLDELDSSEFPVDFETTYFPFGDPSGIDLSDEADQELAKALASDGIERLFFALVAIPTAIGEHFLRLALTGVAMLLYAGVPLAMLFAFFIHTQAFLGAYLKQFINLLIETLLSVIIVAIMMGLLVAAAQQGIGLYIGATVLTCIVLLWRIKGALKLGTAAFDLFGGAMLTGGASGMELVQMGQQAVTGTAVLAGAALTGGATLAAGSAVLGSAAALRVDGNLDGALLGTDPAKTDGRVRQLKAMAGYTLGRSQMMRGAIESGHELRTMARHFRDGDVGEQTPDTLDYLRAGSGLSGFGSNPWLAMRVSPSLRTAYDQIGGRRHLNASRDAAFDGDGEPLQSDFFTDAAHGENGRLPTRSGELQKQFAHLTEVLNTLTELLSSSETAISPQPPSTQSMNGPIPTWLQTADYDVPVQQDTPNRGAIRFEPQPTARRQLIQDVVAGLTEPTSFGGQATYKTLAQYAGADNVQQIQAAVLQHQETAVQAVATAIANVSAQQTEQGMSDAVQLEAWQRGDALNTVREHQETPLTDAQIRAVADMVLLPQRQLTHSELISAIGQVATQGATDEQPIAHELGMPVGFGTQTGNVRAVLAGTQQLQLGPGELTRLAQMVQQGLRAQVQAELLARGTAPIDAQTFINDLTALPSVMTVPQSTSIKPTTEEG